MEMYFAMANGGIYNLASLYAQCSKWPIRMKYFREMCIQKFRVRNIDLFIYGKISTRMHKNDQKWQWRFSLLQIHILFFWIFYLSKNHEKYTSRISQKY